MTADRLLGALALPSSARVDRRVPKTLLTEHAPTPADRRLITAGVEALVWTHALKPTTVGIAAVQDDSRQALEIAVLHLVTRDTPNPARLVEVVHRAIPYPVLLITEEGEGLGLSLAHKRAALDGSDRSVLDGGLVQITLDADTPPAFLSALPLAAQPQASLNAAYQGWMDALTALDAARLTGTFTLPDSPESAAARREALAEVARLDAEIAALRRAAAKEKQIARRADLNLCLARLRLARTTTLQAL